MYVPVGDTICSLFQTAKAKLIEIKEVNKIMLVVSTKESLHIYFKANAFESQSNSVLEKITDL